MTAFKTPSKSVPSKVNVEINTPNTRNTRSTPSKEDSSSDEESFVDKGSEPEDHYSVDLGSVSDVSNDIESEGDMSLNQATTSMGRMSIGKTQKQNSTVDEYSLGTSNPFMMYNYTEDNQRKVAVDFLVRNQDRDSYDVKLSSCGTKLTLTTTVPDMFLDPKRLNLANGDKKTFNCNSNKAVAFNNLVAAIEEDIDTENENSKFTFPVQIVKLVETCDPNVEIDWTSFTFKSKRVIGKKNHAQFYMVIGVELESIIKAKKRVTARDEQTFDSDSDSM